MVAMTDRIPFRARLDIECDEYIEPDDDGLNMHHEGDDEDEDSFWDRFFAFEREFDVRVETLEHRGGGDTRGFSLAAGSQRPFRL